jgi:hypothetical protein
MLILENARLRDEKKFWLREALRYAHELGELREKKGREDDVHPSL